MEMTTLDLVLRANSGALRVPLKRCAALLGIEPQTIRNRLCQGSWPLPRVGSERSVFFDARDIAALIDRTRDSTNAPVSPKSALPKRQRSSVT